MGHGMERAGEVLQHLAWSRGVFRSRDLDGTGVSRGWFDFATFLWVTRRGRGVWSHQGYQPTRYELVQVRHPRAVFWGASALWLHGVLSEEPAALWVAMPNNVRVWRTLDPGTVLLRTRRLEDDVVEVRAPRTALDLRVHRRERAQRDVERAVAAGRRRTRPV